MIFGSFLSEVIGTICTNGLILIGLIGGLVFLVKKFATNSSKAAPSHDSAPLSAATQTQKLATTVATGVLVGLLKAIFFAWLGHRPHHHRHD